MPDHRQKKLAKQKKKRTNAGRAAVSYVSPSVISQAEKRLASQLPDLPVGPCYITRGWHDPSEPRLQCLVATRYTDEHTLVPVMILVDLGCEGVRDAYFAKTIPADGLPELVRLMQPMFPRGFHEIKPTLASAIVHQAVQFAAKVGIAVPERFKPALEVLSEQRDPMEVEMGRRGKPLYSPQPGEDTRPMVKRLVEAVGPDGFGVDLPSKGGSSS
jgi:hypothetical protein